MPRQFQAPLAYFAKRAAWRRVHVVPFAPPPALNTTLLYTRGDAPDRKLLHWERLSCHFQMVMHTMSLPFLEQVRIFSRLRLFVAPCGAHTTNVLFMPFESTVIDIQVGVQNSWQISFGLAREVERYLSLIHI